MEAGMRLGGNESLAAGGLAGDMGGEDNTMESATTSSSSTVAVSEEVLARRLDRGGRPEEVCIATLASGGGLELGVRARFAMLCCEGGYLKCRGP